MVCMKWLYNYRGVGLWLFFLNERLARNVSMLFEKTRYFKQMVLKFTNHQMSGSYNKNPSGLTGIKFFKSEHPQLLLSPSKRVPCPPSSQIRQHLVGVEGEKSTAKKLNRKKEMEKFWQTNSKSTKTSVIKRLTFLLSVHHSTNPPYGNLVVILVHQFFVPCSCIWCYLH